LSDWTICLFVLYRGSSIRSQFKGGLSFAVWKSQLGPETYSTKLMTPVEV
jgi:hypothetical protein